MAGFQKILVPTDFSEHADAALDTAIEVARSFGAKIWLLHCYAIHPAGVAPYAIAAPVSYAEDIRKAAVQRLRACCEKIETGGIVVEGSASQVYPPEAIAEKAEEIGADLIVMGTRGLTGIKHVILGSVAERTMRVAPCPVLTVKASELK